MTRMESDCTAERSQGRWAAALRSTIAIWRRRVATRRALHEVETWRLSDIGCSEAERRVECAKWFWQK